MSQNPSTADAAADPASHWPLWLAVLGLGVAAWQGITGAAALRQGRQLADRARRFETHPRPARARVLVLGDSTGVGVGTATPGESLPGLLAAEFPDVEIVNACRNGARVVDMQLQLTAQVRGQRRHGKPFDLALLLAGGNDVLRLTPPQTLARQAHALLSELQPQAGRIVWLGSADVGTAPALMPPLSWAYSWKCHHTMRLLERAATQAGAQFINFCARAHSRRLTREPQLYFAADGLHPSAASYRHCFEVLKQRVPLHAALNACADRRARPGQWADGR